MREGGFMRGSLRTRALLLAALFLAAPLSVPAQSASFGLLPDIQTIVPKQLQIINAHQRELLRFSNGIVNTGAGHFRLRPELRDTGGGVKQHAIQEILDSDGNIVAEYDVSRFEFHVAHDHWHIDAVAQFEIKSGSPGLDGQVVGGRSIKVTFCLIDWYKLDDNPAHTEVTYFHCGASHQGISPGWVDQYHQATEGQQLDITDMPAGEYYLVSTSNPDRSFIELDLDNNTAWVKFRLARPNGGNPKLTILGHSPCGSPGLCGQQKDNR
jgi:hypothetical protein